MTAEKIAATFNTLQGVKDVIKQARIYFLFFILSIQVESIAATTDLQAPSGHDVNIYKEQNLNQLYQKVAAELLSTVKRNPHAVILLPTGSTPEKMYKVIVERFAEDETIDFCKIFQPR